MRIYLLFASVLSVAAQAAFTVDLQPSVPSPQPLGSRIIWVASASGQGDDPLWYRFRARLQASDFVLIRDYGPLNSLEWTASNREGLYEIEVSVRNLDTGETAAASSFFNMQPLVTSGSPAVTPTEHALVFLYSAPPCPAGSRMQAAFSGPGRQLVETPWKECTPDATMNFYLAGMTPNTSYSAHHVISSGDSAVTSPDIPFTSGDVPPVFAPYRVLHPPKANATQGVLLQSPLAQATLATDLTGNLLWFYTSDLTNLTRPTGDGTFMGIVQTALLDPSQQVVRQFDLAGYTLKETNAARVSEQLQTLGVRPITAFHHEARLLPDGRFLVLASTEEFFTDVQGPGPVNIIGDTILVLDHDLNVVWTWDAFDHLDLSRPATLGELCTPIGAGCPPFFKSEAANDWVHGNSVQLTPDGHLLYSARHQDWLIKIDYNNGAGSGAVIWKLGKDGDFSIDSTDPEPWFSHQHDGQIAPDGALTVFDNGNVRNAADNTAQSRAQAFILDETSRTASLKLNAPLGVYSFALGSAALLDDGNFHFNAGIVFGSFDAQTIEVDSNLNVQYSMGVATPMYRTFRLKTLYTSSY